MAHADLKARALLVTADLEQARETLEKVANDRKAGQATERQMKIAQLRLEAAQASVEKMRLEQTHFEKYVKPRAERDYQTRIKDAQHALEQLQQTAGAKEAAARQDRDAKKVIYEKLQAQCKELEADIQQCRLYAPRDGWVAYWNTPLDAPQRRFERIIAEGEAVGEHQRLLQIGAPGKAQVVLRLPRNVVDRLQPGQPCQVRFDGLPGRLFAGKIKQIANAPQQTSGMYHPDQPLYWTSITLERAESELRSGMAAHVTIALGPALDRVLTLPKGAVLGESGEGKHVSCLVLTADGAEERELVLGWASEDMLEIRSGLREGEAVVLHPQLLLKDLKDRIRLQPSR
jgi:macrolide-specific efflux system membrane fusion protein